MSVEVGTVYAGKFDSPPTVTRQPPHMPVPSIMMGVQADNGFDAVRFCGEADKFHHGMGPMAMTAPVVLVASFDEDFSLSVTKPFSPFVPSSVIR